MSKGQPAVEPSGLAVLLQNTHKYFQVSRPPSPATTLEQGLLIMF